jgi:hypothetical protein
MKVFSKSISSLKDKFPLAIFVILAFVLFCRDSAQGFHQPIDIFEGAIKRNRTNARHLAPIHRIISARMVRLFHNSIRKTHTGGHKAAVAYPNPIRAEHSGDGGDILDIVGLLPNGSEHWRIS